MPTWCSMCAFCPIRISVPEFRGLTDANPRVAKIHPGHLPQTQEFINRIAELLIYLLPHYIRGGQKAT